MVFQFIVGFRELDDYLLIFIFALFLNDLYFKLSRSNSLAQSSKSRNRLWMTLFLILLLLVPVLFDFFHVKNNTQIFISKVSLILWAQIFLLDSFLHYRETSSKKWLLFTNIGGIFIVFFAIAI
jgi:hypothetical protein